MNRFIAVLFALSLGFTAYAQKEMKYSIGVTPQTDSVSVAKLRSRLDNIRKTRPTVALVLAGGGAKGAAHVGVIRRLEELDIPVDVVLGTSMGGLVGGMFALGYNASEMDEILASIDWNSILTDKIDRSNFSYSEKKYRQTYQLSIPFYYAPEDYKRLLSEQGLDTTRIEARKSLGLGAKKSNEETLKSNLVESLPFGYVHGQNVTNLISSLTAGYQDSLDFSSLPVPFVCVATEMVEGKPKIWYNGKLKVALRSTMSIPGVFAPVRMDKMVLVDGGMRDNFPCDIARELGADIIIGVDISSGYRSYDNLNSLPGLIDQGVDMLSRESYERNRMIPDIYIKPDIREFSMMSFSKDNIETIKERGYAAAAESDSLLLDLKKKTHQAGMTYSSRKADNISSNMVTIASIRVDGVSSQEREYILRKFNVKEYSVIDKSELDAAVSAVKGTRAFAYVTYELLGKSEPYNLVIDCRKGPIHHAGVGIRYDSEENVSLLLNYGYKVHSLKGFAASFTGKVGVNPYVNTHLYVNTNGPTYNFDVSYKYNDHNKFILDDGRYRMTYSNFRQQFYLSNIDLLMTDFKVGMRNDWYVFESIMSNNQDVKFDKSDYNNSFFSVFANARVETLDDEVVPSRGYSAGFEWQWIFGSTGKKVTPFHTLDADIKTVFGIGKNFAFIPNLHARFDFGKEIPIHFRPLIGGLMPERYLDWHIPFVGLNPAKMTADNVIVARTDFRYALTENNYITAIANVAASFKYMEDSLKETKGMLGLGVMYQYVTKFGPLGICSHWSSINKKLGLYINFGYNF